MKNIIITIYKILLVSFPIFLFLIAFVFYLTPYRKFTSEILSITNQENMRLYWESNLMPFSRYKMLPYIFAIATILSTFFSVKFFGKGNSVLVFIIEFLVEFKAKMYNFFLDFQLQKTPLKIFTVLVFIAIIIRSIYNIQTYEIQYDEAWTYTNFVDKGIVISALSPHNNHILYSIFAAALNHIPFLEAKYVLRLPVVLAGLMSAIVWLYYWRKKWGWYYALLSSILLISSAPFFIYMLYGRAYVFAFLFAIIQLFVMSSLYIEKTETKDSFYAFFLVLAQVMGMYALPSYLYVCVPAQILILFFTNSYKLWLKINCISIFILAILYAPFLFTNGINILVLAAENKVAYSYEQHWNLYHKLSDWMLWGADYTYLAYFTLAAFFYACYLIWKSSNLSLKYLALWSGTLLILPLFMFFYQPLRVWSVQCIAYAFLISNFLRTNAKLPFRKDLIFGLFFIVAIVFQHSMLYKHYEINWAKNMDKEAKYISALLLEKNIKEVYTYSRYDKPLLEYYYAIENMPLKVYMPYRESKDYRTFAAQKYEAFILDIEDYKPTRMDSVVIQEKKYKLLYKNERIELYLSDEIL